MVLATVGARRVHDGRGRHGDVNVGRQERVASMIAGGALALYGLKRRDLAGWTMAALGAALVRRGSTGECPVYRAMGVSTADGQAIPRRARGELVSDAATVNAREAIKIERTIELGVPCHVAYDAWRHFERLPAYIDELESVRTLGDGRSHWVAMLPGGRRVEWDSEIVNEIPDRLIAWKTVGNPDVAHAGSVHFEDDGGGTTMRIVVDYEPPGGRLGALVAAFTRSFGMAPDSKIREGLREFKERLESGARTTA